MFALTISLVKRVVFICYNSHFSLTTPKSFQTTVFLISPAKAGLLFFPNIQVLIVIKKKALTL